jgi:hypothetical protein
MLFKNSVRASKRTPHFTITYINKSVVFKEIIFYTENNIIDINTQFMIIKSGGTVHNNYHWALKR